jgi:hypothetical protein
MLTPRETILTALADLLRAVPDVPILRGAVLPERVPAAGNYPAAARSAR